MIEEGWRQIEAGVALIVWSRLAFWDVQNLSLVASKQPDFESAAGHKEVPGFTSFDQNVLNWPRPVFLRSLEDYV